MEKLGNGRKMCNLVYRNRESAEKKEEEEEEEGRKVCINKYRYGTIFTNVVCTVLLCLWRLCESKEISFPRLPSSSLCFVFTVIWLMCLDARTRMLEDRNSSSLEDFFSNSPNPLCPSLRTCCIHVDMSMSSGPRVECGKGLKKCKVFV